MLKKAGYNAVRCAHNPPAPAFLDACDRLGLLVMDEIFDCWQEGKNPYDYHMVFDRDWLNDLEAMVLRDRNHPSVIIWSTGNEIPERDGRSQGYAWAERLAGTIRRLDPTRPVTNALNGLSAAAIELNNLESNLIKTSADHDYWGERTAPLSSRSISSGTITCCSAMRLTPKHFRPPDLRRGEFSAGGGGQLEGH